MQEEVKRTRTELEAEINNIRRSLPEPKVPPKIFLTDATPEALQIELTEQGERTAVISDEGNLFDIVAGLYTGGKINLDVLLQGHAGGSLRVKRKDRHVNLNNIAVTLGLAVQPQVLADLQGNKQRSFKGRGFFARFLFCLPESNIGKRDTRKRSTIPADVRQSFFYGMKQLLGVLPMTKPDGVEIARQIGLTEEALELWLDFSQWIEHAQGGGGQFESIQDFTGKLPGQALRIAALCTVAEKVGTLSPLSPLSTDNEVEIEIGAETMKPVIELCKNLIAHHEATMDSFEVEQHAVDAKWILDWIFREVKPERNGVYLVREYELQRQGRFSKGGKDRLAKALYELECRNILSPQQRLFTKKPTLVRYVNPAIFGKPDRAASAGDKGDKGDKVRIELAGAIPPERAASTIPAITGKTIE